MKKITLWTVLVILTIVFMFSVAIQARADDTKRLDWARVDIDTEYMINIAAEHHEVHEGNSFGANYSNAVANATEMTVIAFTTPNTTQWLHCVGHATSTIAATYSLAETTSIDADEGTDLVMYNRNRNSSTTFAGTTIETASESGKVTTYNEGQAATANITQTTTLWSEEIGQSGNPVTRSGGASRGNSEFVLKQNTEYAFIVTADETAAGTVNLAISCYQHTNVN